MTSNLNMDFRKAVTIDTTTVAWVDSPLPGVQRRMLERASAESGHATSIVRYAPGSNFTPHIHAGGEEFFVLEGVFSDETGDFGPGMYVRNPVASKHQPRSDDGCTIFVKLWQMSPEDQDYVRIDTRSGEWYPGLVPGLSVLPLHQFGAESVAMVNWKPGTHFSEHAHPGGEEILVLDGVFEDEHGIYPKGSWVRSPPGSRHKPFSSEGCTIYVKTGHLASDESGFVYGQQVSRSR